MADEKGKSCAIYVATGMPYLIMALNSIRTLKENNKHLPVILITDASISLDIPHITSSDTVIYVDAPVDARMIKTSLHDYTSFDNNVYIDCDTEVLGSLDSGFFLLESFDLAIKAHSDPLPDGKKSNYDVLGGKYKAKQVPHWNSGVIFFNNNKNVIEFFKKWNETYKSSSIEFDQLSLVDAIFSFNGKFCPLDTRWNGSTSYSRAGKRESIVLHYTSDIDWQIEKNLMVTLELLGNGLSEAETKQFKSFIKKRKLSRLEKGKSITKKKIKDWLK